MEDRRHRRVLAPRDVGVPHVGSRALVAGRELLFGEKDDVVLDQRRVQRVELGVGDVLEVEPLDLGAESAPEIGWVSSSTVVVMSASFLRG
jgi:hypothetical protein